MNISYVSWTSFSSNKSLTYISKTFTLEWKSIYYVTKTIYMHKYIEKHIHIKWKSILYLYPNILIKLRRHGKNCTPFSFKLARVLTLHLLMLCGSLSLHWHSLHMYIMLWLALIKLHLTFTVQTSWYIGFLVVLLTR